MPGYYKLSTSSIGYGWVGGYAYQDLGGYVVSYLARQSSTSWTRWQTSISTTAYYMFAQSEPPPPTTFVFPGMTRKAEKLYAPDVHVYSPVGLAVELEVVTTHNMAGITRPLLHLEGNYYRIRVEHTTGSTNYVTLKIVVAGTTYQTSVSKSSQTPRYIRISFYTDNTAKLTVVWSDNSTSTGTVTLHAPILSLDGTLYIGCSPVEGEE